MEADASSMASDGRLDVALLVWYNTGMNTEERQQQKMTFVLPRKLMERLRALAQEHHRSLTGELLVAIETYLKQEEQHRA